MLRTAFSDVSHWVQEVRQFCHGAGKAIKVKKIEQQQNSSYVSLLRPVLGGIPSRRRFRSLPIGPLTHIPLVAFRSTHDKLPWLTREASYQERRPSPSLSSALRGKMREQQNRELDKRAKASGSSAWRSSAPMLPKRYQRRAPIMEQHDETQVCGSLVPSGEMMGVPPFGGMGKLSRPARALTVRRVFFLFFSLDRLDSGWGTIAV
ncbi:hypothetical protein GGI43DRAFT_96082 [Trichoderma evansii]